MRIPFFFAASMLVPAGAVLAIEPEVGKPAPDFALTDINHAPRALSAFKGRYVVLEWTNFGCPFVRKHYGTGNMQKLQKEWTDKDVAWLTICSSAKGKQGYMTLEEWDRMEKEMRASPTAVLPDTNGDVGRLYGAKTTPSMFVVDPEGILIYKGAIDDRPTYDPADVEGATNYVNQALEQALGGKPVSEPSTRSYGCSVKYE